LRPAILLAAALGLQLATGCASTSGGPAGQTGTPQSGSSPDRVIAIDMNGRIIRQSTDDGRTQLSFRAPIEQVWRAVIISYMTLGIKPTDASRTDWRYGNGGFVMSRQFADRSSSDYFRCGEDLGGAYIDRGRLIARVMTTLRAGADGATVASTEVTGVLRRTDGARSTPIECSSTGVIERRLQQSIEETLQPRT
jgi:hypothetical protein